MISAFKTRKGERIVIRSYNKLLNKVECEYSELDVDTLYGKAHCILFGKRINPAMILLHGAGNNSAASWFPNIKGLSEHFYCIAIDIIGGSGKSISNEKYNKEFSIDMWLNEIFDKLGLEQFYIVGHSNGAYIAYWYTRRNPLKVKKAVFLDIVGISKKSNSLIAITNMLKVVFPEALLPNDKNVKKIFMKMINEDSEVFMKYPEVVDHLVVLMKNYNARAMIHHKRYNYVPNKDNDNMLFVFGEDNIFNKYEAIKLLKSDNANIQVIPKTKHLINYEKPELVNEVIYNFCCVDRM